MRVISVYFLCKLYNGLFADHDFTVRSIQVESITRGRGMVLLNGEVASAQGAYLLLLHNIEEVAIILYKYKNHFMK